MRLVKIEVIAEVENDISNDELENEIADNLTVSSFVKIKAKNIESGEEK